MRSVYIYIYIHNASDLHCFPVCCCTKAGCWSCTVKAPRSDGRNKTRPCTWPRIPHSASLSPNLRGKDPQYRPSCHARPPPPPPPVPLKQPRPSLWRLLLLFAYLIANPLFIIPKFIKDSPTSSQKTACFLLKGWIKCGWGSRSSPAGKRLRILPLKGEMIHLQIRVRCIFLNQTTWESLHEEEFY